ncbi:sugar transferase [Aerococcaceae bacterium zg-ZUI334]|nr:sugar transferase [Aerococcaceae bacterium zg-ZUI334]MBS4462096.1 sugar transferase [Aerococcaceae bacterium zg-B36]NEW64560.1 exopolysaccharide biosynthesis polyprenyl glycosylphosphotransferase [Facklamia sp. 252]NEW67767.1 exopolysaccharide biosynthesis polyprenyl glycosylphosphotransferase [Facklamia sp. 253]QQD66464.1 sugar transferase [Aerococcaceae bacterium zg-252]
MDLIAVTIAGYITSLFTNAEFEFNDIIIVYLIHFVAFYVGNTYKHFRRRKITQEVKTVMGYSLIFSLVLSIVIFFSKSFIHISRRGMLLISILNGIFIFLIHLFVRYYMKQKIFSLNSKKVFVILESDKADEIIERLDFSNTLDGELKGFTLFDEDADTVKKIRAKFPNANYVRVHNMMEYVTKNVVDEVLINLKSTSNSAIEKYVRDLELLGIDISLNIPYFDFESDADKKITKLSKFNVLTLSHTFYKPLHVFAKRMMDCVGALVGLLITMCVSMIIIPLIMFDSPGSPFFVQERVGKNGRRFNFYKFRSMYLDADEVKNKLQSSNQMKGLMFKMDNDPRVTRVGSFLRKTSLDELPQFYNVLKGDMSLVGTRPPTVEEYEQYTPQQKRRLSFKPGITGLWQVSGRSEITDFDKVVKLDVEYITNWTIWRDIKILFLTIKVVLAGRGAK